MNESMVGFTTAERFPCRLSYARFVPRFIPMLVMMCLVVLVLVSALRLALPLALLVVAALAAVVIMLNKRQFDQGWGTAELELSAAGATLVRSKSRVHLPWARIQRLGKADLVRPKYAAYGGIAAILVSALVISTTRRPGQAALTGDGLAIVLPIFDKSWENGRIGEWIRAYRPDLLLNR
jgi:hypothetical protein